MSSFLSAHQFLHLQIGSIAMPWNDEDKTIVLGREKKP
jgi:hypothetical protein